MANLFNKSVKVPDDILYQELSNGEIVFLNLDNESYYGLDNTGSIFLNELTSTENIENAYNNLLELFDVSPGKLRNDLNSLLEDLNKNGIVSFIKKQITQIFRSSGKRNDGFCKIFCYIPFFSFCLQVSRIQKNKNSNLNDAIALVGDLSINYSK